MGYSRLERIRRSLHGSGRRHGHGYPDTRPHCRPCPTVILKLKEGYLLHAKIYEILWEIFFWVGIISLLKKTNEWEQIVGRDREERQEPLFSGGRRGQGDSFITTRSGLTVTDKRNSAATNSDGDGVSHRASSFRLP